MPDLELGGPIGVWLGPLAVAAADVSRPAAAEAERLGFGCIWYPEGLGTRESFTNAAVLLGATARIRVASGIANIWGRDPVATANAARVLEDAFEGRFLLGLGVSHPRQVDPRGHVYSRPVARMRAYLEAMDDDPFVSPDGTSARRAPVPRVLAALRPPMLRLAAERAAGAHTFLVPVEHTRRARELLGPGRVLVPEQKVLLETDPRAARVRARRALGWYLDTPNYLDNLRSLGFEDSDFADGGSDRLVDALVAWGDEERVVARLREHLDAGADQVAVHPLGGDRDPLGLDVLRALAPALTSLR
ncbi:MAG TPA: TIGR03620 family F420-dependent LLM class oxidoreductase [Gaiellaceae bacterium]|nr:TIGR03620 family F420-dependent LLM class oxidoreductase [Gaiellaceae bacterium]